MPTLPGAHAIAVMALTVFALFLFTRERVPMETTSLLILVALALGFEVIPYTAHGETLDVAAFFHGFGHEALITICALMIVGGALEKTGALEPVVSLLGRMWKRMPSIALLLMLLVTAILSGFMNNTPIVVMLLPILISIAVRTGSPASATLMPMGFATLIGGSGTIIGTSTNLLVVAVAADLGLPPFSMFSFSMPILIVGSFGILYLWLVAPRLLPARASPLSDIKPRVFDAVLIVDEDGFAAGKTLSEIRKKTEGTMRLNRIRRGKGLDLVRLPTLAIEPGDRLYIADTPENLKRYEQMLGATLHDVKDVEHPVSEEHPLSAEGQQLVELAVTPNSPLVNQTLSQDRFAERHQLVVMAIHRLHSPKPIHKDIGDVVLAAGDVLLAQGAESEIAAIKASGRVLVLDGKIDLPRTSRAPLALAIFIGVVGAAATGLLPISVSALLGTALVLLTRCVTWRNAADALSTQVIMIIAASLALGLALQRTGGAGYLAELLVWGTQRPVARHCPERTDAVDGGTVERGLAQCRSGHRHADCGQHRRAARRRPGSLRAGGDVRRQYGLRHADRLPDQRADPQRGRLQVHRLHAGRNSADADHVDRPVDPVAEILSVLMPPPPTGELPGRPADALMHIRPMTRRELDTLVDWADAEGWNPGLDDAEVFWATDPGGFVAAEFGGELIGGGAIVSYEGRYGFMGFFILRPEFRGRGLGNRLWQERKQRLLARLAEPKVIGMDGVFAMQAYYAKGGFVLAHRDLRFEGRGVAAASPAGIVDLRQLPIAALEAYDLHHFPAPRPEFLARWIDRPGGHAIGVRDGGALTGYAVLRPCRVGYKIGPLFADDAGIAERLFVALSRRVPGAPIFLDVPESNPAALDLARRHGMVEVFGCAKMYVGPPPRLPESHIFGVTTFELG